ncbi:MAG TPA: DUF1349 domain-containing protein [Isosphaeraceae bacterium]|jgi:regulation of enolase protein 1 (concanavalin A-like superfamily)|nr:DUF1349 domain-containing protein [Isosphaeraceae bacterium]
MKATLVFAAVVASATPGFAQQPKWDTVVSQEGNFIVEMPPGNRSSRSASVSTSSGLLKLTIIKTDTPAADYLVYKFEFPTGIIKGAEERALDERRDELAKDFHGKILTEKKVRLENGAPGRDFTLRGRPEAGGGIATVRIREYLSGRAIIALIVVSVVDRELPDDAGRFLGSLTLGTKVDPNRGKHDAEKVAAGKPLTGWGEAVDPDGDCTFTPDGSKTLTIAVPAKLHDLNADISRWNAPRVLREVDGDFVVTVKVTGKFEPANPSTNPKSIPFNGGGLFVWHDGDNYIRLERGAGRRGNKVNTFSIYEEREGGHRGAVHNGGLPVGSVFLRLERRGKRIVGATSPDGKKWSVLKPIDVDWPSKLKVGLDAINSSSTPLTVRFEQFQLKQAGR